MNTLYNNMASLEVLLEVGAISEENVAKIKSHLEGRKNIFIFGSIGSGKTSVLEALMKEELNTNKRNVLIAQVEEVQNDENTFVFIQSNGNLKETAVMSLKHNPDNLFLDEVNTEEDFEAIRLATLTGHRVIATFYGKDKENFYQRLANISNDTTNKEIDLEDTLFIQTIRLEDRKVIEIV